MPGLFGIAIFFGVILFILIFLIVTYFCVRNGECCWHNTQGGASKKRKKEEGDEELSIIAGETADEDFEDNASFYNKPYMMTPKITTYRKLVNEPEEKPTQSSVVFLDNTTVNKKLKKLKIPESVKSVATGYTSTEDDEMERSSNDVTAPIRQNIMKAHRNYVDGARIRFSLLYSKSDLFLMLTINEVEGIPSKSEGGFDFIQVAICLLPAKKYRSKTKFVFQSESRAVFDEEPFKFSNISREKLKESAFRVRVQGKKLGRHVTLGEVIIHLMDVAQRGGGFETWRPLTKNKR